MWFIIRITEPLSRPFQNYLTISFLCEMILPMKIKPAPPRYVYQRKVKEEANKRRRLVVAMRKAGWTWQAIGDEIGISKQRAAQLGAAQCS
jgi:hypothetical protein